MFDLSDDNNCDMIKSVNQTKPSKPIIPPIVPLIISLHQTPKDIKIQALP